MQSAGKKQKRRRFIAYTQKDVAAWVTSKYRDRLYLASGRLTPVTVCRWAAGQKLPPDCTEPFPSVDGMGRKFEELAVREWVEKYILKTPRQGSLPIEEITRPAEDLNRHKARIAKIEADELEKSISGKHMLKTEAIALTQRCLLAEWNAFCKCLEDTVPSWISENAPGLADRAKEFCSGQVDAIQKRFEAIATGGVGEGSPPRRPPLENPADALAGIVKELDNEAGMA